MSTSHIAALTLAIVASIWDLRTRRIPNQLTLSAALVAIVFRTAIGGGTAFADSALGWLAGIALFIVPFALRGMGGGDVKLLGALGAWLGPFDVLWVALYTGVAGGVLAIVIAWWHGYLTQALRNVWLLLCHWKVFGVRAAPELTLETSSAPKLAYAVPILLGTVAAIWLE